MILCLSNIGKGSHLNINSSRSPLPPILPPLQTKLICAASLPRTENEVGNMINALIPLHNRKDRRPALSHLRRIPLHHRDIRAHSLRKIDLVHDQQVGACNTGPALAGHLVTTSNINDVDDEVGEFARVVCGEVVAAGLDEEEVCLELAVEVLQGEEVGADVLADGGVRAAACFDGADALGREGFIAGEELGVFSV